MNRLDFEVSRKRIEDACIDWNRHARELDTPSRPVGIVTARGEVMVGAAARAHAVECTELRGAHLMGLDLRGVDWSRRQLSGAHLDGLDLAGASLCGSDVSFCRITCSSLEDVDFDGACISSTNFTSCSLRGARGRVIGILRFAVGSLRDQHVLSGLESHLKQHGDVGGTFDRCDLRDSDLGASSDHMFWRCVLGCGGAASIGTEDRLHVDTDDDHGTLEVVRDRAGRRLGLAYVTPPVTSFGPWSHVDLSDGWWFGADLADVEMPYAELSSAVLTCADLRGTSLALSWFPDHSREPRLYAALFDDRTEFPEGFDPTSAGLIRVDGRRRTT